MFSLSDGFDEEDYLVALLFRQVAELDDALVGIACTALESAAVPHDGLYDVAGAAVVQAFRSAAALGSQASSPEGCCAAPARAYVVLHPKSVLNEVRIGPYLLIGIARHVVVGKEELGRILDVVITRLPRRTVASGTAYLGE